MGWVEERRAEFIVELRKLMRRYGVAYISDLTIANFNGQHVVTNGYVGFDTVTDGDMAEVDKMLDKLTDEHRKKLIDDALDRGDKEAFDRLVGKTVTCADCDDVIDGRKVQCSKCGRYICERCAEHGDGMCTECEYPNAWRYV